MKRRRIFWILLGCGVVAVGLACLWPREREPRYQGKSLSEWLVYERLESAWPTHPNPHPNPPQFEAIRQIGTNAIPWLLKWVRYEPPPWRKRLENLADKRNLDFEDPKAELARASWIALQILGRQASPAIPELTTMMNEPGFPDTAWYAIAALGDIGPEALPPLLAVLTNPASAGQWSVQVARRRRALGSIWAMQDWGTNPSSVVGAILPRLKDTDLSIAAGAAQVLSRPGLEPEVVVPALRESLRGPQPYVRRAAVKALASLKERAISALPEIEAALNDSDAAVREAATNALKAIAPEGWGSNSVPALKTE